MIRRPISAPYLNFAGFAIEASVLWLAIYFFVTNEANRSLLMSALIILVSGFILAMHISGYMLKYWVPRKRLERQNIAVLGAFILPFFFVLILGYAMVATLTLYQSESEILQDIERITGESR
jgi:uncharacterized membrane protein YidH (DUF202 family)